MAASNDERGQLLWTDNASDGKRWLTVANDGGRGGPQWRTATKIVVDSVVVSSSQCRSTVAINNGHGRRW